MLKWLAGAAALTVLAGGANAAPIEDFQLPGVVYDERIETPDDHFRHGLGDKPVRHDQLVSYLTGLSEASDRISQETIGYTHEGRPILFFTVTSPENHARIDEIKSRHLASLEGESVSEDLPSIVWVNYGVHGAESAGMDAAIPTLYHYAAAQGEDVQRHLDEAVILIVAILNPDGHSRRADHVETFGSVVPVTDPAHAQHQLWTAARTNHYWFDLNRQWLLLTQPEAKAWQGKWQEWKPQVSADFHEMGSQSTFYFHPGEPKRLNPLIPAEARDLTKNIAEFHRDFLDSENRLYFTEQGFDNFYIGKGSTYPQVNGSLGILFEIGAARGGAVESASGERSYADNIRTHFRTTLTTVEGTLAQKEEIADYQRAFFSRALEAARSDPIKGYVFTTNGDETRLARFVDLLLRHDIEVHSLAEDVEAGERTFRAETSFVVPMNQRQYRMARGIFDRLTEFEEDVFYDVSGWTLPLAYDLDYAPLKSQWIRNDGSGPWSADLLSGSVSRIDLVSGKQAPEAEYGYIMPWTDYRAPKALHRILAEDILVRVAREPFEVRTSEGVQNFEAGTVFVPMAGQTVDAKTIHDLIAKIAQEDGIGFAAATSGAGDVATASLGGASFRPVEEPSVLLLFDDGLARYDAGEVWHLLDHDMRIPVTLRRKDELGGLDWSRYTHLVMVGGGGVALADGATERVRQWVREEGGTLIAMRQSASWAQKAFSSSQKDENTESDSEEDDQKQRIDFSEMDIRDAEHVIGGAIVATDLDISHPLGFGYSDRMLPTLRNTTLTLDWPEGNPYAVVAAYPEVAGNVLLSGYVSDKRRSELAGTPAVIAREYGRGNVVLMADNPVFRGTFLGTNKLFLNAIFFSDLIDNPSGDYTSAIEE